MKDRVSTKVLENGAIRYGIYDEAGILLRYEYIKPEDEPTEEGSAIDKANFLPDVVAEALGLDPADNPEIKDALQLISENFLNTTMYWWEKYNLVYEESLGTVTTLQGVGNYYYTGTTITRYSNPTFDPSTGEITFGNTSTYTFDTQTTTALNNWYIIFNNIVYKCSGSTTVRNVSGTYYHDVTAYPVGATKTKKGSFIEDVSNLSDDTYPSGGIQNGYYYASKGHSPLLDGRITFGSYTGTGASGASNPNSIPALSPIKMLLITHMGTQQATLASYSNYVGLGGNKIMRSDMLTESYVQGCGIWWGDTASFGKMSTDGKTFSWYNTASTSGASRQLNESGTVYRYIIVT